MNNKYLIYCSNVRLLYHELRPIRKDLRAKDFVSFGNGVMVLLNTVKNGVIYSFILKNAVLLKKNSFL